MRVNNLCERDCACAYVTAHEWPLCLYVLRPQLTIVRVKAGLCLLLMRILVYVLVGQGQGSCFGSWVCVV